LPQPGQEQLFQPEATLAYTLVSTDYLNRPGWAKNKGSGESGLLEHIV